MPGPRRVRPGSLRPLARQGLASLRLVAALVLLLGGVARAAHVGIVVGAAPGAPAAGEVAEALAGPLEARGDTVDLAPFARGAERRRNGAVERPRLEALVRTQALVEEGWRAYLAAEPGFAEARLAEARLRLVEDVELEGARELIADATFRLGAVRLFGGRAGEAAQAFALAARLDPARAPSPREVSPDVIEAFQRARAASPGARQELGVRVTVEVGDTGLATLAVDGGPPGPVTARIELASGEHLLVARAPGHHASARLVRVPGIETTIELALERDAPLALLDDAARLGLADEGGARATLGAAIVFADLDEVIVVGAGFRGGDPTLRGQRCAGVPTRCGAVAEVRYAARGLRAAATLLTTRLAQPGFALGKLDAMTGLGVAQRERAATSSWRRPWPWIALGAAVALVTTLALIDGDAEDPRVRVCVIDGACP